MSDSSTVDQLRLEARKAREGGRYEEALRLHHAATQAGPEAWLAHHDLGGFLKLVGRLEEAESSLREALRMKPDAALSRHALGIVLLSQGRYREGWPFYDARHEIPELRLPKPALPFPEWRGEDVAGKRVLIFPEQGFGDQIQYARFAGWLADRGAKVTLLCAPPLAGLLAHSLPAQVIPASGAVDFPDPDYWVMSGSVAGRAGLEPDDLPNHPYLTAPARGAQVAGRIGVVARGNPTHTNDINRSAPPGVEAELMRLPGAVSLQPEDTGARDFADTAAIVAGLEAVVTVDTSVAHLAGAMGKPVYILLPRLMTDWRWMEGRRDSPWYPTATLLRQSQPGDWLPMLAELRATFG